MKKFAFIVIMMISFVKSFGQTHTIKVIDVQRFEHPANVTTYKAIESNLVELKESYVTEAVFVVDLENKNINYSDFSGINVNYPIVTINKTKSILNFSLMEDDNKEVSFILDYGADKKDGIVLYVRYNKMIGDVLKTRGWVSTNVSLN